DHVLGHPAHRVGGRAVDLRRVLAGEGAAAVAGHAAVGVDGDLPAGQCRIAHRSADDEPAGRVDQQAVVGDVDAVFGELGDHRIDHVGAQIRGHQVVQVDVGGVLGGHHHGVQAHRLLAVVFDGDLGLAVRAQV